jgi:hypothetical protein
VQNISVEHPDYASRKAMWRKYRDLYAGGEQLKEHASEYLTPRQKEPADVYGERLSKVFYENYVGSIIDWYAATLFRREPELHVEGPESGRKFFSEFADDCDLKGTNLSDFFRKQLIEALVCGVSYTLVDFPKCSVAVGTRAEEDLLGASRAYLVDYPAESLTNWSRDEHGNYEWVVLKTEYLRKSSPDDPAYERETIWRLYDRTHYRVYRKGASKDASVELVDQGRHALSAQGKVPIFELKVSDGLWLMNKAGLLQLEHFNKSNALSWALTMGLFATPVIYSDRPWNQIVGEAYYIQLGPEDKFGWTEPEGHVFRIAAENLTRLQEEIYRVCFLMIQATGSSSAASAQSGLSKMRDFAITQEVLRAYGDAVKDTLKRVMRAVQAARCDDVLSDVSGLDEFDIRDFSSDLEDAERLLSLGIQSPTLKRQVLKRLAYKYLCDVRQDIKDRIATEIDENSERG